MNYQQNKVSQRKSRLNDQKEMLKTIIEIRKRNKNAKIPYHLIRNLDLEGVENHLNRINNHKRMVRAAVKIQAWFRGYKSRLNFQKFRSFKPFFGSFNQFIASYSSQVLQKVLKQHHPVGHFSPKIMEAVPC